MTGQLRVWGWVGVDRDPSGHLVGGEAWGGGLHEVSSRWDVLGLRVCRTRPG